MAFGVQQINPIDLEKSKAVGLNLPFTGPTGLNNGENNISDLITAKASSDIKTPFKCNHTTAEATKNNLINYFLTNPGERPMNPTFGAGLRAFIFEHITTDNLDFLEEKIGLDLQKFFPNINIDNLEILDRKDINTITVSLNYSIINTNISDTLEMNFA
tara:strand:+ start:212 stop:688 length:477 start_codon:yes stop_codon:yes gene_type:complete